MYEWRSGFASAALAIVNAFFDSCEDLGSDKVRSEFAEYQLRNGSFLYKKAQGDDRTVKYFSMIKFCYTNRSPWQTYRGLFQGTMILQTFAMHFSAIMGAVKVPDLAMLDPSCALALSVGSVNILNSCLFCFTHN